MEVVTGATSSLLPKLGVLLQQEYNLQDEVKKDIESVQTELIFMNAALRKVAAVPEDELDEQVRTWAIVIKELSFDMEDAVTAFMGGVQGHGHANTESFVMELFKKATNMLWMSRRHHRIAGMIEEIRNLTTEVSLLRDRYRLDDFPSERPKILTGKKKSTLDGYTAPEHQQAIHRLICIKEPVGVREDMLKLQDWIMSRDANLGVLSIFGFGGVGKTTIAMALYKRCRNQFKSRAVITGLSQYTDPATVLRYILSQIRPQVNNTGIILENKISRTTRRMANGLHRISQCCRNQEDMTSAMEDDVLSRELSQYLQEDRYLLLIEDVWSVPMLGRILSCLPLNEQGSRIIVTTRSETVAMTPLVRNHYSHLIKVLPEEEAQNLFYKSLLESRNWGTQGGSVNENDQLPSRVWEMCGGVPLPIITMAGLVESIKPDEWTEVCKTLFPENQVCRRPEDFRRIINYCYNVLSSDLKTCSLYLCIFPMGRKVSRKRLIRRWIAEGFVSSKQGLSVEDAAEACFNQLVKRKIVRPVERNSDGTVKSCQVHDMVLEYLLSKAGEENFAAVVGGHLPMLTQNIKVRRLSRQRSDSESAKEMDSMNMSRIRSMTVFGTLDRLRFSSFKTGVVQVLDLQGCQGFKANHVMDICEMTLLKYLGLRGTDIRNLPSTIGNLKYLETLDIRDTDVQELPKPVLLLEQIRNILGGDKRTRKALKMPKEFKKGAMKNLRILSGIEITLRHSAASYLTSLTRLTKLAMYKIHTDDDMLTLLGDSIEHLGAYALQTLVVDHDSSDLFKALNNMNAPVYLSALELSGKLLQLPKWLPELNKLTKLTLSATVLQTDNLVLLSKLRSLFSLTFSIHAANQDPDIVAIMEQNKSNSGGEIFVPAGGFHNLRLLRISLRLVPSLNFCETGTPELERIELCFGRLQGLHGIHKLGNIHEVLLIVNDIPCQGTKLILDELKKTSGSHKYALIFN